MEIRSLALFALAAAAPATLLAADVHVKVDPSAVHANPGQEDQVTFPTIVNALDHHPFATPNPDGTPGRVYIEIVPGTYHERVIVTQNHNNVTLVGLGKSPSDVVITNSLNAKIAGGTFFTETMQINGTGFEADNLTIENTAGNTGQAVAVANRGDRSIFKNCHLLGHQDTLFADYGRQYYVNTYIEGGVDYIFGNAAAVLDHDTLNSNGPGYITAQSRTDDKQTTGYVILNSKVTASFDTAAPPMDPATPGAASAASAHRMIGLGRPWRAYGRAVFIKTELPAEVNPLGWDRWGNPDNEKTAWYAESENTGPGADTSKRAAWAHKLTPEEARQFYPGVFLRGSDNWNPEAEAARLP
jgi:pectinesterase